MNKYFNLLLLLFFALEIFAQNAGVAINEDDSDPDNSAILDVKSTNKGFLAPRMSQAQREAIPSPANGLMVFQTDNSSGYYIYNNGWDAISGGNGLNTDNLTNTYIPIWNGTNFINSPILDDANTNSSVVRIINAVNDNRIATFSEDVATGGALTTHQPNTIGGVQGINAWIGIESNKNRIKYNNDSNLGFLHLFDGDVMPKVNIGIIKSGADTYGFGEFLGPNETINVSITSNDDASNNGKIQVHDLNGSPQAGMLVNINGQGEIFADVKNFKVAHPFDPKKEIFYASVEGPEVAMYVRGKATLQNGEVTITFPEHFQLMALEKSMTIQLTPRSASSKGLAVINSNTNGFTVKELWEGTGNYEFDWEAKSIRKGHEDYKVVRDKIEKIK